MTAWTTNPKTPNDLPAGPVSAVRRLLTVAEGLSLQALQVSRSAGGSSGGSWRCLMTWPRRMRVDRPAAAAADNDAPISQSCNKRHYDISRACSKRGVVNNGIYKN